MKIREKSILGTVLFGILTSVAIPAQAANFSFNGSFDRDDNVQLFGFSVGAPSNVTLRSYSYAGGTQANGNSVASGGFDPILALFDSAGNLVGQNDDGGSAVPAGPNTGATFDVFLQSVLSAGDYTVSVMQFDNFANGPTLADGFVRQGDGNFTAGSGGCTASQFCDVTGSARTGNWAFDILNVDGAVVVPPMTGAGVPTPALLPGLIGMGMAALRKRRGESVVEEA